MSDYPLESFVFYRSFRDAIDEMSDEDKLATLLAICDYALYGIEPKLKSVMPRAVFTVARPSIDANKARRVGGKKGGRPKKNTNGFEEKNHRFSKTKSTETETVSETVTETDTATETDSVGSAPPAPSPPAPPPVIGLPLNDGTEYGVTEEQCREWAELYPAVDVLQELRKMRGWLDSNKARRKTKRGISRFITGWLSKEQDRGRSGHVDGERRETHGAVSGTGGGQGQPAKKWGVPVVEL